MRFYLFIILGLFFLSCSSFKDVKKESDANKYRIAYNYLLKNNYIDKSYEISDTIIANRLSYFNYFFCKKPEKLYLKKNDTIPSPEIIKVAKCLDSLNNLDIKNEIVPYYFPLQKILNNTNDESEYLVHFSVPVDDAVMIVVCHVRENNVYYECGDSVAYYLKVSNDSVIEFYKQVIHH